MQKIAPISSPRQIYFSTVVTEIHHKSCIDGDILCQKDGTFFMFSYSYRVGTWIINTSLSRSPVFPVGFWLEWEES